ncbi:MAG: M6 family metalloprotease domain-containing protein [Prevotella sp.]|nr:M6 family metalloprotease domain-containing protein [Prevotella sp.]
MRRICFLLAALLLVASHIVAIPAHPGKVKVRQPDGTSVTIRLVGDEWLHFNTTDDGYSVVKDSRGSYVYAERREGCLVPTAVVAHDVADRSARELSYLRSVSKFLTPEMPATVRQMKQIVEQREQQRRASRRAAQYDYSKFKGLIVLIEYKDQSFSRDDYPEILNGMVNDEDYTGYDRERCTGSVRDYFSDNSGGRFKPTFDVAGPYQVDYNCLEGSSESNNILLSALDQADADVDFSDYDGDGDGYVDLVFFVVAGNGANYDGNDSGLWWPHRSVIYSRSWNHVRKDGVVILDYASSTELRGYTDWPSSIDIDGIGTICHEFSHVLGLPDFYDTDYKESGGESLHPGEWSVMAGGSYMNNSRTPVGYSLYERYSVGFYDEPEVISAEGKYELEPLYLNGKGYRIDTPVKNEFFLLENRQQNAFKWDEYLPGSGMLVHRVDFTNQTVWNMSAYNGNKVNADPSHNYYEVVRAGGASHAGTGYDVFPGTGRVTDLHNTTSPANLKTWSGESTKWGLTDIWMNGDNVTFDVSNTYVLSSLSLPETATVGVGLTVRLEATAVPAYADYTLTWASSDIYVARVDEAGNVTGVRAGTADITVTSNNGLTATCRVTVEEMTGIDVAEFKQQEVGTDVLLQLQDAEVLYVYDNNAYVRDSKGSVVFSNTGLDLKKNDRINGQLLVRVGKSNNMPQVVGIAGSTNASALTITQGDEVKAREVWLDYLTEDDYADLVVLKAAQLERNNGVWAVSADRRVRLYNPFQITGISVPSNIAGKYFDVEGIYGTDVLNGKVIEELYRVKAVVEVDAPTGISEVRTAADDSAAPVYNLQGQRLSGSYKGLVIRNGKKYVIK